MQPLHQHGIEEIAAAANGPVVNTTQTSGSPEAAVIKERGIVYGDPRTSHRNIGLAWTGLLQQHYGIQLDHPLPSWLVAQMMVVLKVNRAARVFKADNYLDLKVYAGFAEEWQGNGETKDLIDPKRGTLD